MQFFLIWPAWFLKILTSRINNYMKYNIQHTGQFKLLLVISWIRPWFSMLLSVFLKLLEQGNCTLRVQQKRSYIRDHRHFGDDKNTIKRSPLPTASKYIEHLGPLLYIPSKHILQDNFCIIFPVRKYYYLLWAQPICGCKNRIYNIKRLVWWQHTTMFISVQKVTKLCPEI